ncbi:hypothetical protein TDB9533_04688 [Thalassocella blandensis]|nr:hypothetical protein TDB9533_04688 [Thalassocella blandensis]
MFVISDCVVTEIVIKKYVVDGIASLKNNAVHSLRYCFFIAILLCSPFTLSETDQVPTYVYWQGEASEARKPFELALMKRIFEQSESKFGPAHLEVSQWKISTARSIQMMKEGERLHIQNAPYLLHELDKNAVTVLPTPILRNILGYRQIIIKQHYAEEFNAITSFNQFAAKAAGQGRGWADNNVYRANGIEVIEAPSFLGMFPMLNRDRFDYIPLGISEAGDSLELDQVKHFDFVLAKDLIVFYPWPIHILVSNRHPELARRIQYGFEKIQQNGMYDEMFNEHFGSLLAKLKRAESANIRVIVLTTPNLPAQIPTTPNLIPNAQFLK